MNLFVRRDITQEQIGSWGIGNTFDRTEASVRVNHDNALSDDAILAAVTLLAGDIARLPMRALETDGTLSKPMDRQPHWLTAPDPLDRAITATAHKMQVALSILLAGNGYILCEPDVFDPVSLTVLDPTRIRVRKPGRERLFDVMGRSGYYDEDWSPADLLTTYSSAQVLHIPYMLRPGRLKGLSPIDAQFGNVSISIAMRKWVETFFGKGGQISGLVVLPQGVTDTEVQQVQDRIQTKWSSWRKAGVVGVLSGGANWVKTGLSPQDADIGMLWKRQLEMAARIYGIPPFMIGSQEPAGVAYASAVERSQHYIDHCLMHYTGPMEAAYSMLVPGDGRLSLPHSNTEVRFIYDAFLRGDPKARWDQYLVALQSKARTIDEVRALENLPPMGDYSQDELEGPGGLLQTPNNNPRQFPAGDQGPIPPDDALIPPAPPTVTGPTAPPAAVGRSEPVVIHNYMPQQAPVNVTVDGLDQTRAVRDLVDGFRAMPAPIVNVAAADSPVINVNVPEQAAPVINVPQQAAPVINVARSEMPAPVINVTTPKVQDIRIVSQPPLDATIKRDVQGRITKVTDG